MHIMKKNELNIKAYVSALIPADITTVSPIKENNKYKNRFSNNQIKKDKKNTVMPSFEIIPGFPSPAENLILKFDPKNN